ncbi:MAG: universal stress protein [Halochromatium sp.]|nr:universal stress protein [Halochromatium sp.]
MSSNGYTHLLVGVDFAPESEPVLERALMLRDRFNARLSLVNVVDYVAPGTEYAGGAFIAEPILPDDGNLEKTLLDLAQKEIDALGERLSVPAQDRIIEAGPTGRSIQNVARDIGADLIIVGVHERNWLGRLLGSTPQSLLKHEVCDVLAVRLDGDAEAD